MLKRFLRCQYNTTILLACFVNCLSSDICCIDPNTWKLDESATQTFLLRDGTFGDIVREFPKNQAVLDGDKDVNITCFCSGNLDTIKWSFTPVGGTEKIIKNGPSGITDNAFEGTPDTVGKSYNLTVRNADSSTAGTYTCDEHTKRSVLLIVLQSEVSCDYSPRDAKPLPCDSTLQLSCAVSYVANTSIVTPSLYWWPTVKAEDLKETPLTSGTTTTTTSRVNVKWPEKGEIETYTCTATFTLYEYAVKGGMAKLPPDKTTLCQPFTLPVPCTDKDGSVRTGAPTDKSKESSARSAETSNLAIRVLGVAGVLLLAQMF